MEMHREIERDTDRGPVRERQRRTPTHRDRLKETDANKASCQVQLAC